MTDDVARWIDGLGGEHGYERERARRRLLEEPARARPALVALVERGEPDDRTRGAMRVLAQIGDEADVPLLAQRLKEGGFALASDAALALAEHPAAAAEDALLQATAHADPEAASAAAFALGQRKAQAARPTLERLLGHPDERVRFRAALALGALGPGPSAAALRARRAREDSADVRSALDDALRGAAARRVS